MKKGVFLSTLVTMGVSTLAWAQLSCPDFSGHYRFDGPCDPTGEELIIPEASGFLEFVLSRYAPMTSEGSFEIKQEGCDKLNLTYHSLIKDSSSRKFRSRSLDLKNEKEASWAYGWDNKVLIKDNILEIGYHSWEWSTNPLLLILRSTNKIDWTLRRGESTQDYKLKIHTKHKTWVNVFNETKSVSCSLKKDI